MEGAEVRLPARPSLALAAVLGWMLVFTACSDGRTPVVLYSPHGRDLLKAMETAYETAHPEIDVRWLDMGSQEVYDRIRSEAVNPQADVWFGGPDTIFARGVKDGLLDASRPLWADAVAAESRAPGDLYFGLYRTLPVLVYNSAAVSAADAPGDWDDLLAPRWKGQILIRDPVASGTMRTVFAMILARSVAETGNEERGWGWLRRLDSQTKEYAANPTLLFEKLQRREGLVTIWELSDILLRQRQGVPFGFRLAQSGTPVIDDAIGLVKGCRHPVEAKAFMDWAGSAEAQQLAAREAFKLPARTDIPPAELPEWTRGVLPDLRPVTLDWNLIEVRSNEWMARWDHEVRGHG